jgi:hypothetical protein
MMTTQITHLNSIPTKSVGKLQLVSGGHDRVAEDSVFPTCDSAPMGNRFLTFRRNIPPSSSRV